MGASSHRHNAVKIAELRKKMNDARTRFRKKKKECTAMAHLSFTGANMAVQTPKILRVPGNSAE
ncbi:MAG: hypothetical protein DCC52_04180 [Chloroflexi bacterium]|nr:MAG: hypothetical protein DCC52_04180 [Chloroflexota bacterium]